MLTKRELLAYLDRIEPALGALTFFELLDVDAAAGAEDIRTAFQTSAVRLHPDLYRRQLSPADHERLTGVYARIAEAYLVLRSPDTRAAYERRLAADLARGAARRAPRDTGDSRAPRDTGAVRASRDTAGARAPRDTGGARAPRDTAEQPAPASAPTRRARPTIPPEQQAAVALLAPRAQRLYRLALAALQTGDISSAVLNLRMAARSAPNSALLQRALQDALARLGSR